MIAYAHPTADGRSFPLPPFLTSPPSPTSFRGRENCVFISISPISTRNSTCCYSFFPSLVFLLFPFYFCVGNTRHTERVLCFPAARRWIVIDLHKRSGVRSGDIILAGTRNAEHVGQKCVFSHKNGFIEFWYACSAYRADMKERRGGGWKRCGQKNRNAAFVHMTRDLVLMKSAYSILALIERME